jgi:serine protease
MLKRKQMIGLGTAMLAALAIAAPARAAEPGGAFVPGELLVSFEGGGERILELPEGIGVAEARRYLQANPSVSYALPNFIARAAAVPNDPGRSGQPRGWRSLQWNFLPCGSSCGQSPVPLGFESPGGINAIDAWTTIARAGRGSGKGARVAVLDTGIAYKTKKPAFKKSPDFAAKQFIGGYDFVTGKSLPHDRDGHGTHVAGTIAERNNNGIAATGLAPGAKIIPVRVLDAQGLGNARDITRGIRYAAKRGADVINMSFEFSRRVRSCKQIRSVCKALRFATKRHRALVVAASGNGGVAGGLSEASFPARAPRVLGVGATTRDGCIADYSNFGLGLDLVAPGGGTPAATDCRGDNEPDSSRPIFQLTFSGPGLKRFGFPNIYKGTSMAAAHVSGVAAMVISSRVLGKRPSRVALECQLTGTARDTSPELGQPYDPTLFGAGLMDAARAVTSRAPGC